jgi:hypothetical protein
MLVTYKDAIRRAADEVRITARLRQATAGMFNDVVILSLHEALKSLLASDEEAALALRHKSNVEAAENAITGMIEEWQRQRLQKAARLLYRLAASLADLEAGAGGGRTAQLSERLGVLAAEFLNASPSISLAEKAA